MKREKFKHNSYIEILCQSLDLLLSILSPIDAFRYSRACIHKSIKYDSLNPEPYLKIGSIYEDKNESQKAIKYLQKLSRLTTREQRCSFIPGFLYYRSSQNDSAYFEYKKAIVLMDKEEREDFVYKLG